ncbi:MAG TPA: zf-HC2 domain-containing protein [Chthonomonadaceae bacterium]|nr:zf-HC2 domain-containing protein [Chthonomonadaceae bacterium]
MSDRCRFWRRQLSRLADDTLPMAQRSALEDHLARCPRCRAAEEADRALREALRAQREALDATAANRFDNRVLVALRRSAVPSSPAGPALLPRLLWVHLRLNVLPLEYLSQIACGALVAALLTALCLTSALHPASSGTTGPDSPARGGLITVERNEPPVPLESLLQSPSPRAALLWTAPSAPRTGRFTRTRQSPKSGKPAPQRPSVPVKQRSALIADIVKS